MIPKLHKYQKLALLIPLIPNIGVGISILTDPFRISMSFRWLFLTGKITCLALWLVGITWAIINGIAIVRELKLKWVYKILWLIINSITVLWLIIGLTIGVSRSL